MPRFARLLLVLVAMGAVVPAAQAQSLPSVTAELETRNLFDDEVGGEADADDPAIWIHSRRPAKSLVIATKKNAGLDVYGLDGALRQSIAPLEGGRFNNVDVLEGAGVAGGRDLAVVTDRGLDRIRIYAIDGDAAEPLTEVTAPGAPPVFSPTEADVEEQATVYGLAGFVTRRRTAVLAVSRRSRTDIAFLRLTNAGGGRIGVQRVGGVALPSTFRLPNGTRWTPCNEPGVLPQVEGMAFDPDRVTLMAGQEAVGIWRVTLGGKRRLIDRVREFGVPGTYDAAEDECAAGEDPGYGGKHLSADVEGLTFRAEGRQRGYLLASSQGDDTFAVYDRRTFGFLRSFAIGDGAVDGVQESDGADVSSVPLPGFPRGLLVTQDGQATPEIPDADGEPRAITNFKFTPWQRVADLLPPPR